MKDWKKSLAVVSALTMLTTATVSLNLTANAVTGEKYEFEDGVVGTGAVIDNTITGFSGTGYVDSQEGDISVTVTVPSTGMYEVKISYCLPEDRGSKNQSMVINGVSQGEVGFTTTDEFKEISIGSFKLTEGENVIEFKKSWGWIMFDYLTVEEAVLPELTVTKSLCDIEATDETKRLMSYLVDNYGEHILSGQQELYGQAGETEFEYIYNLTGEYPAIRGFDFMNNTQGVGWDDGTMSRIKDWVKNKNGIATVAWHWNVPLDISTYTEGSLPDWNKVAFYNENGDKNKYTNFSPKNAVIEGTPENDFINKDIEIIANQLLELQEEGIPIIFRPLHEAEGSSSLDGSGSWFWWGNDGAEAYVELYHYVHDKLVKEYGVHNVIWEWNSYTYETSSAWYPGDDYVDIIAYDKYNATDWSTGTTSPNESAISGTFYNLVSMYNGDKMVAMAENDTVPSLDNLVSEKAGWLYFCPWYDADPPFLSGTNYQNADTLKELYQSDYCITRDELPADLYTAYSLDGWDEEKPPVTSESEQTQPTETTITVGSLLGINGKVLDVTDETITVGNFEGGYYANLDPITIKISNITEFYDEEDPIQVGDIINMTSIGVDCTKFTKFTYSHDGVETTLPSEETTITSDDITTSDSSTTTETSNSTSEIVDTTTDTGVTPDPTTVLGDINCDGNVKSNDLLLLKKYLLGLDELSEQGMKNADMNQDNDVKSNDLLILKKQLLGLGE